MGKILVSALLAVGVALGAHPARAADSYGVNGEELVVVKGKVVDLLCEVAKDCVAQCGAGRRQLGLLTAEGKLFLAAKSNTIFAGLTHDLLPYCGQEIIADGLLSSNYGTTLLMIQQMKRTEGEAYAATEAFAQNWAVAHGTTADSKVTEEWFRADESVAAAVAKRGKLGVPD